MTVVAKDATGLRLPPQHTAFQSPSPYSAMVPLAFPKDYSILISASVSLTRIERETLGASFLACQIVPTSEYTKYPNSARLVNISEGNVECRVQG